MLWINWGYYAVLCLVAQSCPTLFATPWAVAHQAPLSMGILQALQGSNPSPILQEGSLPSEPPGKPKNTKVGSLSLLQWIFSTQESNCSLLHCRLYLQILYLLSYQRSPKLGIIYDNKASERHDGVYFKYTGYKIRLCRSDTDSVSH